MNKHVVFAVIHRMGSQEPDFSDDLIDELRDRILASDQVAFKSIYWADVLLGWQADYLHRASTPNDLDYMRLRRFIVGALSDASAFRCVGNDRKSTYGEIHTRVHDAIKDLLEKEKKLDSTPRPLVILAHSLGGGHIMSNYIGYLQKNRTIV